MDTDEPIETHEPIGTRELGLGLGLIGHIAFDTQRTEPTGTDEPNRTDNPSPANTDEPISTDEPIGTDNPSPVDTHEPVDADDPIGTDEPGAADERARCAAAGGEGRGCAHDGAGSHGRRTGAGAGEVGR